MRLTDEFAPYAKKYKIRTRNGYRPQPSRFSTDTKVGQLELPTR